MAGVTQLWTCVPIPGAAISSGTKTTFPQTAKIATITDAHAYRANNDGGSRTTSNGGLFIVVAAAFVDADDDLLSYSSLLWIDDERPADDADIVWLLHICFRC